jgi:hypothetical protein
MASLWRTMSVSSSPVLSTGGACLPLGAREVFDQIRVVMVKLIVWLGSSFVIALDRFNQTDEIRLIWPGRWVNDLQNTLD